MGQERVAREGAGGSAGVGETARALPLPFCSLVKELVDEAALVPLVRPGMVEKEAVAETLGGGGESSSSFESVRSTMGGCEGIRAPAPLGGRRCEARASC